MIRMDLFTMVNGLKIKKVVKVKCSFQMALFMMDNGKVIKCTARVFISHAQEIDMRAVLAMG